MILDVSPGDPAREQAEIEKFAGILDKLLESWYAWKDAADAAENFRKQLPEPGDQTLTYTVEELVKATNQLEALRDRYGQLYDAAHTARKILMGYHYDALRWFVHVNIGTIVQYEDYLFELVAGPDCGLLQIHTTDGVSQILPLQWDV